MNERLIFEKNTSTTAKFDDESLYKDEVKGAFGSTVKVQRKSGLRRTIFTFLVIMGPGLIVMIGDNDAGGVTTYTQAGEAYSTSLLWVICLLIPVLIIAQVMAARLGAVTGVGHAKLLRIRFGPFWSIFSLVDLFLLNALTIMTEFIGVSSALLFFNISKYISVPLAVIVLFIVVGNGSFRRWESIMFILILVSLLVFPLMFLSHPHYSEVVRSFFIPGAKGGFNSTVVLLVIALVGTTVAPWQLFFQQSNVIDKRITVKWLKFELAETVLGAFLTNIAAAAMIIAAAFAFAHTPLAGNTESALAIAKGFSRYLSYGAGVIFSFILLSASLIGATAVTLSTSYAIGDLFNISNSLSKPIRESKGFYAIYLLMLLISAAVVLIPGAPLGIINLGVQVIAGLLLPSSFLFLVLLANDRQVMKGYSNSKLFNFFAYLIVFLLYDLSFILTVSTLFPSISLVDIVVGIGALNLLALVILIYLILKERAKSPQPKDDIDLTPLLIHKLGRLKISGTTKFAISATRLYLVVSAIALVLKLTKIAK